MDLVGQLLMGLRTILLQGRQKLDVEGVERGDFARPGRGRGGLASLGRRREARHSRNLCTTKDHYLGMVKIKHTSLQL
jgi:hypothetical protein